MSAGQLFLEPGGIPLVIQVAVTGVQSAQRQFETLRGAVNRFRSILTQTSITIFVFSMLMRRQRQTARRLQTVQENVGQTMRRYGRHSLQARQALRQLEQAQESAKFAQIEMTMQTFIAIGSIGTLVFNILDLIGRLSSLEASYLAVAYAKFLALGPAGKAVFLATAGIGAFAIGQVVLGGFGGGGGGTPSSFDQQWAEAGRYVKDEWNRQRR